MKPNYRVVTVYWPVGQYCVPTPGGVPRSDLVSY
jgi:hypothetical protein